MAEKNENMNDAVENQTTTEETIEITDNTEVVENSEQDTTPIAEQNNSKEKVEEKEEETIVVKLDNGFATKVDWSTLGKRQETYSDKERFEMEKMYDATLTSIAENEIVDGTVVAKTIKEVVINIGYKSEGIVSLNEFRYNPDLKEGDKVEVYIETKEDRNGQLILSHKKARSLKAWERINKSLEEGEIINGYIKCRTKGGLIADVFGIEAFLPGSQIDVKPILDYNIYVGKTMEFKVVKINHEFKNVVVSHKALIEAELEQQKASIIANLEKGQVLEGTIKNITSYGVFMDLGGVDGLVHITDLSWGRISHPDEIVQIGDKLNVVILDFDDDKKRIQLGLKQLVAHPWDTLDANIKEGDKVKGKVVIIADYGAFVEVSPGVEGLVHVSEMSWSNHLKSAQDFFKVGDEVEAVILTIDREDRKMSLGVKQLKTDPWETIDQKYAVDSRQKGTITNISDFGIFVEIEEGVDGLIHISDLSWSKKINHPSEIAKMGSEIEAVILGIDRENRRLSLGYKQLEENPWDVFQTVFTVGSIHDGTVMEIMDKGAIVILPYGVEGFAPKKHLAKADGTPVKKDEVLSFNVIEFSKEYKRIVISHAKTYMDAIEEENEAKTKKIKAKVKATNKVVKDLKKNLERSTLGDFEVLSTLKSEMEEEAKEISEKKKKQSEKREITSKKKQEKKD